MVTGSAEKAHILRLLCKASFVNQKSFKCLKTEKLWRTNPFIVDDLFVFLHQDSIVLTISLYFWDSLHGRISEDSLDKLSKFSSKYMIHRLSKLIFLIFSCLMGLSLFVSFVFKILLIVSEISFASALCTNSWWSEILLMWITPFRINYNSGV